MSLATLRKSGEPVATPIWFAEVGGRLYVRTASHFGKRRRIQNNPAVTVAACSEGGELTGTPRRALARVLGADAPEIEAAEAALEAKYPDVRPAMTKLLTENDWTGIYVEIRPPVGEGSAPT